MNLAKSCFWPVWPFMSGHKKKQRKISFSEPLDMPPLKSFYRGLTKQKRSTTRCVPSSNSGDLCFLLFRFSCGVSSTRTKNNERSISHHFPCTIKVLGDRWYLVLRNKKVFGRGGCLHPAPVISAFFFFVLFLEFLLREQIKREQFFRIAWYATIYYRVSPGVLQNIKVCTKVRAFLQLLWFLLFRFSFGVSSTRTKSSESSILRTA